MVYSKQSARNVAKGAERVIQCGWFIERSPDQKRCKAEAAFVQFCEGPKTVRHLCLKHQKELEMERRIELRPMK